MPQVTDSSFKRPTLRENPKFLWRHIINSWPFFVWTALVLATLYLYTRSRQFGPMIGEAEKVIESIAPLQTGRLKTLHVVEGDRVKAGQVVAEMDDSLVDAQLAASKAALAAEELRIDRGLLTMIRNAESATNDAFIALQQQKQQQQRDEAQLEQLKTIQKQRDELYAKRLISASEESALKPQIAALERSIAAFPQLITTMEGHLAETAKQGDELHRNLKLGENEDAAQMVDQRVAAHIDMLKADVQVHQVQKNLCKLCAARDGMVSQINVYPGNIVQPNVSIMDIATEKPIRIIGFLPELRLNSVKVGQTGYAFHQWGIIGAGTGKPAKVTVTAIAPEIETLPGKFGANTSIQTLRERRVVFSIDEDNNFIAGETVQIRMTMPLSMWLKHVFGLQ
jgi:multidrug resistance efflux pump